MSGHEVLLNLPYSTSLLTTSKPIVQKINKIIFGFTWDGKVPKIKKKKIIAEKKLGGLNMLDFELMERSLKIAWIKRFMDCCNTFWKINPNQAIGQFGGFKFFSKCYFGCNLINLGNLPEFYRTILTYWQDFKSLDDVEEMSVLKHNLEQSKHSY